MGRRSFISVSSINRLASTYRANQRRQYRQNLIDNLDNESNKLPIKYKLCSVDFDETTRIANIIFESSQNYRTIVRYVTQDYVRYPVYSDWKCKKKLIKKKIKLTNDVLENLNEYNEQLVKDFAQEIIDALNNENLIPSWFKRNKISDYYNSQIEYLKSKKKDISHSHDVQKQENIYKINSLNDKTKHNEEYIDKINTKLNRINKKIDTINNSKYQIIFSIITFSICSRKRRNSRLIIKKEKLINEIKTIEDNQSEIDKQISILKENIASTDKQYNLNIEEIQNKIKCIEEKCNYEISLIEPLLTNIENESEFIPLKQFKGLKYEKIMGCYIIKNNEKYKCYVGQSKDVFRRLNQHFKGTKPQNIIFAEDYYTSSYKNKDEIFDIRIVKCKTKDELDLVEKELIELYDSFNNGYNGTNGNS